MGGPTQFKPMPEIWRVILIIEDVRTEVMADNEAVARMYFDGYKPALISGAKLELRDGNNKVRGRANGV